MDPETLYHILVEAINGAGIDSIPYDADDKLGEVCRLIVENSYDPG